MSQLLFNLGNKSSHSEHVHIVTCAIPRGHERQEDDNEAVSLEEEITENRADERHDTEHPVPEIKHSTTTSENRNINDNEPRREKTGLRGFRPGLTQTWLYSHRR